ncbi:cyclin-dependent kinase 2-interacting protein-like isoform X2 [Ptychodera flava]|uniref:cyclin-dependent kinase 2-interacting protein-like isoform X2 n=1 Tax=Ptychodera flava TaxID=63121 RepID=UPI003969E57C
MTRAFRWPPKLSTASSRHSELVLGELVSGKMVYGQFVSGEFLLGELEWGELVLRGSEKVSDKTKVGVHIIDTDGNNDSDDQGNTMPVELGEYCEQLETVFNSLAKLLKKMETICKDFKGVCDLEWHQNDEAWSEEPIFQTWPTKQFHDSSCEIFTMYKTELDVKKTILQEIAHTNDRDLMMFYVSTLLHQPYIEDKCKTLLESMLLETGHR